MTAEASQPVAALLDMTAEASPPVALLGNARAGPRRRCCFCCHCEASTATKQSRGARDLLYFHILQDLRQARDLRFDVRPELLGRIADHEIAGVHQLPVHRRIPERRDRRLVERRDNLRRCAARDDEAVPVARLERRITRLGTVGYSFRSGKRALLVIASARSLPARTCGSAGAIGAKYTDVSPESTAVNASPPARYGTCSRLTRACSLKSSPAMNVGVPTPPSVIDDHLLAERFGQCSGDVALPRPFDRLTAGVAIPRRTQTTQ